MELYILVGEFEGECEDRYPRPSESLACSSIKERLELYKKKLEEDGHDFVNFRIEKVVNLDCIPEGGY